MCYDMSLYLASRSRFFFRSARRRSRRPRREVLGHAESRSANYRWCMYSAVRTRIDAVMHDDGDRKITLQETQAAHVLPEKIKPGGGRYLLLLLQGGVGDVDRRLARPFPSHLSALPHILSFRHSLVIQRTFCKEYSPGLLSTRPPPFPTF